MHDHAPRGGATLPGSAHGAEKDRLRRHIDIGAGSNDERVVATEFHDRSAQAAMNRFRYVQTHVDRAGRRDQWNPRVLR